MEAHGFNKDPMRRAIGFQQSDFSPHEVVNITNELEQQEIPAKKISLEQMKARSREYRANGEKSVNRSGISQGLRSLILSSADGLPCPTCNTPMRHRRRSPGVESPDTATIEHILPIKEGGANAPDNLIAMCLACNRARGYAYNQTLKFTQADIDDTLEWLWLHVNEQRLARVVELRLGYLYPQHQAIFERSWVKQYACM